MDYRYTAIAHGLRHLRDELEDLGDPKLEALTSRVK